MRDYVKTLVAQDEVDITPVSTTGGYFIPPSFLTSEASTDMDSAIMQDLTNEYAKQLDRQMMFGSNLITIPKLDSSAFTALCYEAGRRQAQLPKRIPSYRERQRRHRLAKS